MRQISRSVLLVAIASLFTFATLRQNSSAQDSQSLGDAARQSRQQKRQKEAQAPTPNGNNATPAPKTPKIITNEEIPAHVSSPKLHNSDAQPRSAAYSPDSSGEGKLSADQWREQIQSVKGYIASLQASIDRLNDSIHYAGANCVSNCVQWNERQQQKEQQVEQMKAQLEDTQKRLEDLQDTARQQGYGSAVYEP
jgi:hypothetical protein